MIELGIVLIPWLRLLTSLYIVIFASDVNHCYSMLVMQIPQNTIRCYTGPAALPVPAS